PGEGQPDEGVIRQQRRRRGEPASGGRPREKNRRQRLAQPFSLGRPPLAGSPLPLLITPFTENERITDDRGRAMANEIKLPRLKENVDSYEVTEVLVAPGQVVSKDQ